MLTALAIFALVAAVAIAIVLILAAARPDTFHVERAMAIAAPPERIFPLISDFRNWRSWSPYEKLDPAMKRTLSGADSRSERTNASASGAPSRSEYAAELISPTCLSPA